jgi:hypothetical protein
MTQQKDDEGWRKAITSLLLKGQLVVTIDNIESTLWAPSLAAILTATSYQDRILGRSEMVTLPNHATWIGTGNNIRLAGDLPRRCIWVRLDAKTARPWLRDVKGFRHPHLIEWASAHRGAILAAILTIARAWVAAGRPEAHDLPNLGGYESYSQVVGGVLGFMGVDGFLGNLDALYDETDIDTPQWEGFLEAWRETIGETPVTAAELLMRLKSTAELHAALPDAIADTEAKNYIRRLGNALARKKGVRFPHGLSVNKVGEFRRAVKWQIVSPKNADSHQFSFKCESCESGMTRHAQGGQNDIKDEYIKGVKQDSQDSQLATKSVSLAPMPSCYGAPDDDFNPDNPEHVAKLERELDQYLEAGDEHGT